MKQKLSLSIEEERVKELEEILKRGLFRNKSHIVEYALIKFLENEQERGTN